MATCCDEATRLKASVARAAKLTADIAKKRVTTLALPPDEAKKLIRKAPRRKTTDTKCRVVHQSVEIDGVEYKHTAFVPLKTQSDHARLMAELNKKERPPSMAIGK